MDAVWVVEPDGTQSSAGPPLSVQSVSGALLISCSVGWLWWGGVAGALWAPQKAAAASQRESA